MTSLESAAAWSEVAAGWERRDAWVSRGARPVTERLLARLDPRPGEAILELGCGVGEVGRLVAELVGDGGRVLSTDQSPAMVEVAARRAAGLGNLAFEVVGAQAIALPAASFDGVVARFALMLVPDVEAALAGARRVLRPEGRLVFAVWAGAQENPWGSTIMRTLIELGLAERPEPDTPGPFRLGDPERLRALVTAAGFGEPTVEPVDTAMRYASFDEFWEVTQDLAMSLRNALAELPPADVDELRSRVAAAFEPYAGEEGLAIPGRAWVVTAAAA